MNVVDEFPHPVRHIENVFIPMRDGARLAARIWMPEDAETSPVPALLEYIPYRKRDLTRARDALNHPWFAGHGYACVRVDLRGSGDSDDVLRDQYLEQEQEDGADAIAWIASQPWCTGAVGMFGISWGGFNALQVAATDPPALKAIVTVCSTDDLYRDNMHYMGGCLLGDHLSEACTMFAFNSLPPDPEIVGERWREMWHERLRESGLWLDIWLRHQRRDQFWRRASVCENYAAVTCPVMAVGGWADGYTNAILRLLANLTVPRLGLIGPWCHKYPHTGIPGPAIGFLQECLRWWDYWLKGSDTGIMDEPMLRAWMQASEPPSHAHTIRPGRWVAETAWPSERIEQRSYVLGDRALIRDEGPPVEIPLSVQSPLSVGLFAGKWCSYSATPDLPGDQREEDGGSLVFDTEVLDEPVELLGRPELRFAFTADQPNAMLCVRLSDILPDGKASRITFGLLNLAHLEGHEEPAPLVPGTRYEARLRMNAIAQSIPKGHRIRCSISTSYWPLAWLPPRPAAVTIFAGGSELILPIRPSRQEDTSLRPFGAPECAPPLPTTMLRPGEANWRMTRDLATYQSVLEVTRDEGTYRIDEIDLEVHRNTVETYSTVADDFTSARGETRAVRQLRRGDWDIRVVTHTRLSCTETQFRIQADLDAYEGDQRVYAQSWDRWIPRDHV